ncbi:MAG: hypothetical protein A3J10_00675 [Candidatus Sungbacteria bacterium RIFCSPLOWO2_02_FULL_54_10]|nr:MAG: hypothetical protein A3J10_00675 [Candidatus Sungbacteria bacterium RIFCSPLOWO2_02_FULL_54_10]
MTAMRRYAVWMVLAGAAAFLPLAVFGAGSFNRDLYYGMRGDADVARLQDFLRGRGYFNAPESTGNFFGLTRGAVQQLQSAYNISPVSGYFGPLTRAVANKLSALTPAAIPPAGTASIVSLLPPAGASPYRGKIEMSSIRGRESTADKEQVTLRNTSSVETINVTGFRIENSAGGSVDIPKAFELPGLAGTAMDPIRLRPEDQVVITFGTQERRMNFRENLCTGYFDQTSKFSPSLAHRCPRPDVKEYPSLSDACIKQLQNASSCRIPKLEMFTDSACADFAQAHFNYAGCVKDYREKANFYGTRWLVWLQRDGDFFRNTIERVTLKDQAGKTVDEFEY